MSIFSTTIIIISKTLWSISLQTSLLFIVIGIVSLISRNTSSLFKYWIWCIFLLRLCIPFSLILPIEVEHKLRDFSLAINTAGKNQSVESQTPELINNSIQVQPSLFEAVQPVDTSFQKADNNKLPINIDAINYYSKSEKLPYISFVIWVIGVITLSVVIFVRMAWIRYKFRNLKEIEDPGIVSIVRGISKRIGLRRKIKICYLQHDPFFGPAVAGIFNSKLIIPQNTVNEWTSEEIEPVILHELIHVKRNDLIINYFQMILQVIYFFHPLVWYVNWKIRNLNEDVCDDLSITLIGKHKKKYSQSIWKVLENNVSRPAYQSITLGFFREGNKHSARRIIRIAKNNYKYFTGIRGLSIISLFVIGIISTAIVSISYPLMKTDYKVIMDGAKLGDGLVTSGKGNLIWNYVEIDATKANIEDIIELRDDLKTSSNLSDYYFTRTSQIFYAFDGLKSRYDQRYKEMNSSGVWISTIKQMAYNEEKMDYLLYESSDENSIIKPRGMIKEQNRIPAYIDDPRYNGIYLFGSSLMSLFQDIFNEDMSPDETGKINTISIVGENIIDDVKCKRIQANFVNSKNTLTVWLAPNRNYRPKRIELSSPGKITTVHNIFKKYEGNVWFTNKIIKETFLIDVKSGEKVLEKRSVITVDDDFEINADIPETLFEIKFPVGLKVYDNRTKEVVEIQ